VQGIDGGRVAVSCLLVLAALAGCGYTVGSSGGSSVPHEETGRPVRAIAVPILDNTTPEPLLGEIVSKRVKAELLAAGAWRIANTGQRPELVLNGRVSGLKSTPVAFDTDRRATEYQLEIHVDVTLNKTADGSTIWSAPDLVGRADYYVDRNSVALSRESKERAFQDAGQRLAENIVQQLSLLPNAPAAADGADGKAAAGETDATPTTPPPVTPPPTAQSVK
jgi:outer membrane lipopolysaccharide assembly protein LptE/RlpB